MRNKFVTSLLASSLLASAFLAVPAQVRAVPGPVTHWVAASGTPIAGPGESCAQPGYVGATQVPITDALNEVNAGDTVHICAGTYRFAANGYNASIPDDITIEGAGAGSTILDGGENYWFFSISLAESVHHATITGITFQNGYAEDYAGAFDVDRGNVEILNCAFINNVSGDYGGAVYTDQTTLTVTNTSFTNNSTANQGGGALYIWRSPSESVITNSTFTHNGAEWGGAVVADTTDLLITNSIFSRNYTDYESGSMAADYGGAGVYVYRGHTTVVNSSFMNNSSPGTSSGAGILLYQGSLTVDRSRFTGNRAGQAPAIYSWGDNAGFYDAGESITVTNSSFISNQNIADDDGGAIGHERNGRDLTLTGNTFRKNTGAAYGGAVEAWLVRGDLTITNNRFIGNRATEGGALWIDVRGGTTTIRKNLFTENRARFGTAIGFECESVSPRAIVRNLARQNRFSGEAGVEIYKSKFDTTGALCLPPG